MATDEKGMVLRSVYVPLPMDEELRSLAFKLRVTKSQLVRYFVHGGLEWYRKTDERMRDELFAAALAGSDVADQKIAEETRKKFELDRDRAIKQSGQRSR